MTKPYQARHLPPQPAKFDSDQDKIEVIRRLGLHQITELGQ
jgi:hypothetical protein